MADTIYRGDHGELEVQMRVADTEVEKDEGLKCINGQIGYRYILTFILWGIGSYSFRIKNNEDIDKLIKQLQDIKNDINSI